MSTEGKKDLRNALKNQEGRDSGKRLLKALRGCETGKEVMDLLFREIPDPADLKKRMGYVSNLDEICKIDSIQADFRMARGNQRNQDFVCAAAQKWCDLTGKKVAEFKNLVAKNLMARTNMATMQKSAPVHV